MSAFFSSILLEYCGKKPGHVASRIILLKAHLFIDHYVTNNVLIGPIPFAPMVTELVEKENVTSVVNMCWEWNRFSKIYKESNIEQLYLPVSDYTVPPLANCLEAALFIHRAEY